MSARRMGRSGLTLIELVLVLALTATLTGAVGYGFMAGLDQQRRHTARQSDTDPVASLERQITRLIEGAKLTEDAEDTTTYMVGTADATGDTGTLGCDTLVFTTTAGAPDFGPLLSEDDYETQYTAAGPAGGVTEVQLGGQLQGRTESVDGLLVRIQRPSDGDYTQGGNQRVLSGHVGSIGFRFWNGESWDDTWDTATERRLPGAILVSYVLADDATETVRTFTVAVPASDVDANSTVTGSVE